MNRLIVLTEDAAASRVTRTIRNILLCVLAYRIRISVCNAEKIAALMKQDFKHYCGKNPRDIIRT